MSAEPWHTHVASAPSEAPTRRVLRTEYVGPFVVMPCDDGTVWVHGDPPHNDVRAWPADARLSLAAVRAFVAAIDAADDRTTLARLARVIAGRYAADPASVDLLAWVDRRRRELTAPSYFSLACREQPNP